MKNNLTILYAKALLFKSSLSFFFLLFVTAVNAQQYTENFASSPTFTAYPGVPSWIQTATVTLGGTVYEFSNAGNGGWQYQSTGGASNSANLLYSTAATTFVIIKRQDGKRFQFYGAWLKYTNYNVTGYSAPWLRVTYTGSALADQTYGINSTVTLNESENVTDVTLYFSGLHDLNFDNIIVGPAIPIPAFPETDPVSIFSDNSATFSGDVTDDGGGQVTESGLVYSTSPAPTVADIKLALSSGLSSFSQDVTGLQSGTIYYVRSYAINSAGTSYGPEESFTTYGTFTIAGVHDFNSSWVSTYSQNSPFTKYVEGWDATGESTGSGVISVSRLTNASAGEGLASLSISEDVYSEELMYMSMKPHDGSLFNLLGFLFRYDVQTVGTSFGTITVTGYRNGTAVSGATQNILNVSPASDVPTYNSFAANPNAFDNIDEFRLTASNGLDGAQVYSFDIDSISAASARVLPLTYTSVKAYQQNTGINVTWNVASEINIDHYEIEKSADGQQFLKVCDVSAKAINNSSATYNWYDVNAFNGNNFYRIKSISKTGSITRSQIVNVFIGGAKESISVNPNLITGNTFNLQLNNQPKGKYTILLYSSTGQQLYNKTIEHAGGSSVQSIDITKTFAKGIYQLRVNGPAKSYVQQVIKN